EYCIPGTNETVHLALNDGAIDAIQLDRSLQGCDPKIWQGGASSALEPPPAPDTGVVSPVADPLPFAYEVQLWDEAAKTAFDQKLYELLQHHDGVFVGETHEIVSVAQALTYLMPALKAKGVTTLSIEHSQAEVDGYANCHTLKEA